MVKFVSNIIEFVLNMLRISFCHHFTSYLAHILGEKKIILAFDMEISAEISWFQNSACGNFPTFHVCKCNLTLFRVSVSVLNMDLRVGLDNQDQLQSPRRDKTTETTF